MFECLGRQARDNGQIMSEVRSATKCNRSAALYPRSTCITEHRSEQLVCYMSVIAQGEEKEHME